MLILQYWVMSLPCSLQSTNYDIDHVLFGTDAPFAVMPAGANAIIVEAIDDLHLSNKDSQKIFSENYQQLVN